MQRIYIALALTLALTIASAAYTPSTGYVKAPIVVVPDGTDNFTTPTTLGLASTNANEISLTSYNYTTSTVATNASAGSFNYWLKKLDSKALTISQNNSITVAGNQLTSSTVGFGNGYAYNVASDNETGTPQLRVYQTTISSNAALTRLTIGNNTVTNYTPAVVATTQIGKVAYVFYLVADKKVNFTSFTIGGSAGSGEYTLTTNYNNSLQVVWGEALGGNTVLALWREGTDYKSANVDVSKGTVTANTVTGFNTSLTCSPYSTDKKFNGEFCVNSFAAGTDNIVQTWVRSTNNTLTLLSTYNNTASPTSAAITTEAYGPYLAVFLNDGKAPTALSYEIWDLEKFAIANINSVNKTRTNYVSYDSVNSTVTRGRVPAGGSYVLLYNRIAPGNITNIQVGQLLSGSYLASVFGFIMTIVAGLFLF